MATFLDGPFAELCNDELGCLTVESVEIEVLDREGNLIGEVAQVHINGHDTLWMARNAFYAKWGDIPGRPMGWAGRFHTEAGAIAALRRAVAEYS